MRVDKMAMANAVEVRVPFLDRDLLDFALAAPESFKLRDGVSKEPLKRLAARLVGRDAVYRPKSGFGAPIEVWFRTELGSSMREMLLEDGGELARYFDLPALRRRLDVGPASGNQAFQLWVVYNLMVWRQVFLSPRARAAA
jgi:asparagine synthase (glutamine-hydrolysing)